MELNQAVAILVFHHEGLLSYCLQNLVLHLHSSKKETVKLIQELVSQQFGAIHRCCLLFYLFLTQILQLSLFVYMV